MNKYINNLILLPLEILLCNPDFLSVDKKLYNNKSIKNFRKTKNVLSWTMKSKNDIEKYKDKFDSLICNINDCI